MPTSLGREKNGVLSVFFHLCKTDGFRVSLSFSATLLYCHFSLPCIYSWFYVIVLLCPFLSPRIYGSHSQHNHLSLSAPSIVYPSLISPAVSLRRAFDSSPACRIAVLHLTLVLFSVPVQPLQIPKLHCRRVARNWPPAFSNKSTKQIGEHLLIFK